MAFNRPKLPPIKLGSDEWIVARMRAELYKDYKNRKNTPTSPSQSPASLEQKDIEEISENIAETTKAKIEVPLKKELKEIQNIMADFKKTTMSMQHDKSIESLIKFAGDNTISKFVHGAELDSAQLIKNAATIGLSVEDMQKSLQDVAVTTQHLVNMMEQYKRVTNNGLELNDKAFRISENIVKYMGAKDIIDDLTKERLFNEIQKTQFELAEKKQKHGELEERREEFGDHRRETALKFGGVAGGVIPGIAGGLAALWNPQYTVPALLGLLGGGIGYGLSTLNKHKFIGDYHPQNTQRGMFNHTDPQAKENEKQEEKKTRKVFEGMSESLNDIKKTTKKQYGWFEKGGLFSRLFGGGGAGAGILGNIETGAGVGVGMGVASKGAGLFGKILGGVFSKLLPAAAFAVIATPIIKDMDKGKKLTDAIIDNVDDILPKVETVDKTLDSLLGNAAERIAARKKEDQEYREKHYNAREAKDPVIVFPMFDKSLQTDLFKLVSDWSASTKKWFEGAFDFAAWGTMFGDTLKSITGTVEKWETGLVDWFVNAFDFSNWGKKFDDTLNALGDTLQRWNESFVAWTTKIFDWSSYAKIFDDTLESLGADMERWNKDFVGWFSENFTWEHFRSSFIDGIEKMKSVISGFWESIVSRLTDLLTAKTVDKIVYDPNFDKIGADMSLKNNYSKSTAAAAMRLQNAQDAINTADQMKRNRDFQNFVNSQKTTINNGTTVMPNPTVNPTSSVVPPINYFSGRQ